MIDVSQRMYRTAIRIGSATALACLLLPEISAAAAAPTGVLRGRVEEVATGEGRT